MAKKKSSGCGGFQITIGLLALFCAIGCLIAFLVSNGIVGSLQKTWDNGVAVTATATQVKSALFRNNVELKYQVGSEEITQKISLDQKSIDAFAGEDKDKTGELEIHYDPNKPNKVSSEYQIVTYQKSRKQYLIYTLVSFGVFLIMLVWFIIEVKRETGGTSSYSKTPRGNVVDLRTNIEKEAEKNRHKPLSKPLEGYAQEIADLYDTAMDFDEREQLVREIGKKMNDHDKQMLVAYRVKFLYEDGANRIFDMRQLEYAWDGIGGWMA